MRFSIQYIVISEGIDRYTFSLVARKHQLNSKTIYRSIRKYKEGKTVFIKGGYYYDKKENYF